MIVNFDVLPDETGIIYTDSNQYGEMKLFLYSFETKAALNIFKEYLNPNSVRISRKGQQGLFHSCRSCYLFNWKDLNSTLIYKSENQNGSSFGSLSPQGDYASFIVHDSKMPYIHVYDLNTKESFSIKESAGGTRFPIFSFSGQYIAFTHQKLNDFEKRRFIHVLNVKTKEIHEIPKEEGADCIMNANGWSDTENEIIYSELSTVKTYNPETHSGKIIMHEPNIREAAYCDSEHLLLISDHFLTKVNTITNEKVTVYLENGEHVLFRPSGSEIRIINGNIYFLTDRFHIHCWYKDAPYYTQIVSSIVEIKPIKEVIFTTVKGIPVYQFIPVKSNGIKIILAIGGPNEEVSGDDPVLLTLVREGYDVIAPVYRGCTGNPYIEHEMGIQDVEDIITAGYHYSELYGQLPLVGYSYGGLLTYLSLAKSDTVFSCGVCLWAVTSLDKLPLKSAYYFKQNLSESEKQQILSNGNAVINAGTIKTPLIILHGTDDTTSETEEVEAIHKQLTAHQIVNELVIYPKDGHSLRKNTEDYLQKMYHFIRKTDE